ncbi:AraC family transcriptional regulator [Spongiimicrobium salis]|uniref:AraC family transcriptional regulator n=1 Tax=Spongiimicrobium salis TaxID=1667022 RepID=UPI00374DD054
MSRELHVEDVHVSAIVLDMAQEFNAKYEVDQNQHYLKIPEEFGVGSIKTTEFSNGIGIVEGNFRLDQPFHFKVKNGILHPLKFMFSRRGSFKHWFKGEKEQHEVKNFEHLIVSSNPASVNEFLFPAHKPISLFSLEVNRKEFEPKIAPYLLESNEELVALFRDVNGINQFLHKGQYGITISKLIKEFVECQLEGFMKFVFLESKAQEILVLQLKQYLDDLNAPGKIKMLRQATIASAKEAVRIIENEIENTDKVSSLATRVGLSTNTLQQAFQVLFKTSVNDYISNYKIEKARELIETTPLNITEITYRIGINSRSYFSKRFKERFGLTPKQYYTKIRDKRMAEQVARLRDL